jgi:hypothetical protein
MEAAFRVRKEIAAGTISFSSLAGVVLLTSPHLMHGLAYGRRDEGGFGEVHVVLDVNQGRRELAMKCTKYVNIKLVITSISTASARFVDCLVFVRLNSMTPAQRLNSFLPMCEEALLMAEYRHHPNLIALQHTDIAGDDFLLFLDLVEESMTLDKVPCSVLET